MTAIRWASIIADASGEIEQEKLKSLAAIGLGIAGGVALYLAMTARVHPQTEVVVVGVISLVAPLTGAKIADIITSWRMTKAATVAAAAGAAANPNPEPDDGAAASG